MASDAMKLTHLLLASLTLVCLTAVSDGQTWSGILDPSRAIDWSQAGVVGGIPNRTTICTTLNPGATASQINTAISNCSGSGGGVVSLNAGTYNIGGLNLQSNVTLRGAGANQTFLVFSSTANCMLPTDVCFQASGAQWTGGAAVQPGGSNAASWTSGYSKGSTQITLSGVGSSGLSIGQYIFLDQANDTKDTGNLYICDNACSAQGGSPGRTINGINHSQVQAVRITAISGSTYTISPGLYAPNWSASKTPGAWWSPTIQNAGIENVSVDHSATGSSSGGGVVFVAAFNCWIKGVRSISNGSYRNHIWLFQSGHNTIQDSYFYGAPGASLSYGVESRLATDDLTINNVFQHVTTPLMDGSSAGEVYAYNFIVNDYYAAASSWQMPSAFAHDAGTLYSLFEGNFGVAFRADIIHGGSGLSTLFRNRWHGYESGKTNETEAVILNSYNRYENLIGNILGTSGYHTTYQNTTCELCAANVYEIGTGDGGDGTVVPADPLVLSTILRWGNYDTVNNAVRWQAAEVPSSLSLYANPVPASQILPASFYYSAQPGWWPTSKPWPPIGPDVTGGNIANVGGHAYTIPAQDCYLGTMGGPANGSGSPLSFNASSCYSSSGSPSTRPLPATGLTLVVH